MKIAKPWVLLWLLGMVTMLPARIVQEMRRIHPDGGGAVASLPAAPVERESERLAVVLCVATAGDVTNAEFLIRSLREFAGPYRGAAVYVTVDDPAQELPLARLGRLPGVHLLPLTIDAAVRSYPFSRKAFACAQVETLLSGKKKILVWLDNEIMVTTPPTGLDLATGSRVAVRPVFLTNKVALAADAPADPFWNTIHARAGSGPAAGPVLETLIDGKNIRFYINCQVMAWRPETGLAAAWRDIFSGLVRDAAFQKECCADGPHRIFLHQAVLSALIAARIPDSARQWLDNGCGYPLQHQSRIPAERRITRLEDTSCVILEQLAGDPQWPDTIAVSPAVRRWISATYGALCEVTPGLFREQGQSNAYLVRTPGSDVLIDPAGADAARGWLRAIQQGRPLRAILLTHGHRDHWDGCDRWRKAHPGVPVIAQREFAEFLHCNDMLAPFLAQGNARQQGRPLPAPGQIFPPSEMPATRFFAARENLRLGGWTFSLRHTGGETPDSSLIWVPQIKAVFIGDNFYTSFPMIYTPRGTTPRWALHYIRALDEALALRPEILLPGHGEPVRGADTVRRKLTAYRDAVRFVHDAVVQGMNQGQDVHTLMREIKLPPDSGIDESYGRVSWSVRGIWEGYAGWFDRNIANLYDLPVSAIYPDLVELGGGVAAVAARALAAARNGDAVRALRLSDVALQVDPAQPTALQARMEAIRTLLGRTVNFAEFNWLNAALQETQARLKQ